MVGGEEVATTFEISNNIMKEQMIQALVKHAEAEVDLHKANIEVYMQQVVGIGEHSDIIETIQKGASDSDVSAFISSLSKSIHLE